jgi:hypothetical protein
MADGRAAARLAWASDCRGGRVNGFVKQLSIAGLGLGFGLGLLPILIYFAGVNLLGRYEGASLVRTYQSIYAGLAAGSIAAWIVVLGPYLLFLLGRALLAWWRAAA